MYGTDSATPPRASGAGPASLLAAAVAFANNLYIDSGARPDVCSPNVVPLSAAVRSSRAGGRRRRASGHRVGRSPPDSLLGPAAVVELLPRLVCRSWSARSRGCDRARTGDCSRRRRGAGGAPAVWPRWRSIAARRPCFVMLVIGFLHDLLVGAGRRREPLVRRGRSAWRRARSTSINVGRDNVAWGWLMRSLSRRTIRGWNSSTRGCADAATARDGRRVPAVCG